MRFTKTFSSSCYLTLCLLLAALLSASAWAAAPVKTLRVLAWPGYADADVVKAFEQRHGVHVELTLISSDVDLWQWVSINKGAEFDVFAVNTAELQRYIDRQLVQPIDPEKIPNTRRQMSRFREVATIPGLTRHGKTYGIPYTYAEMGLIYDRRQFTKPPDSIAALWDPRLRGRVLAYNGGSHNFSLAALALGDDSPFDITEDQWSATIDRLIALRRNTLGFYTQPQEATELFLKHRVALLFANYGSQQVRSLRAAGADIGYVIPGEGALAWLDCWVITSVAKDRALAHAWIDFMLEEPVSELLPSRQGLASTLATANGSPADERLRWLQPVENVERREQLWRRIFSGDRREHVLAP